MIVMKWEPAGPGRRLQAPSCKLNNLHLWPAWLEKGSAFSFRVMAGEWLQLMSFHHRLKNPESMHSPEIPAYGCGPDTPAHKGCPVMTRRGGWHGKEAQQGGSARMHTADSRCWMWQKQNTTASKVIASIQKKKGQEREEAGSRKGEG